MKVRTDGKDRLHWDVALFFALYIILPSYFGVELHAKLPLITGSRMLLIAMGMMLLVRRRAELLDFKQFHLKNWNLTLTQDKCLGWTMFAYFAIIAVVDIYFLRETSESIKDLFIVVAEQFGVVWLLTLILDTRKKLVSALRCLLYASGVVAVIAGISCILDKNLFYVLNTVHREMMMTTYYRLGLLRADATFGHPVYYGAFCAVMIPLGMYFTERDDTRLQRVLAAGSIALNLVGLVLSNSRGSMLAVCCLAVIVFFIRLVSKQLKQLFKTYLPVLALTLALLVLLTSMAPVGISFLGYVSESMFESVDEILPDLPSWPQVTEPLATETPSVTEPPATEPPATEPPATEPPVEFGENPQGMRSRLLQMTGIIWTIERSPIFGFGPNAHKRGLVQFQFYENQWWTSYTLDIAPVAMICQYGLLGFAGFALMYLGQLKTVLSKKYRKDPLMITFGLMLVTYFLCLLSISDLDKFEWVLLGSIVCLVNIIRKENAVGADQ